MSDDRVKASSSKMAKYTLFMLTIAYALNFVDRQILVILQESIKLEMGLSDLQLGLLSGFSFALVYITAGIPIAYWADRSSRRNIIAIAITVWSGMTIVSGLAQNYTQLLLARIGVGIGEAGGSPPAHSMISDSFPPEKRATALSIYSLGVYIGLFIGFIVGGYISQQYGWRIAFMAVGFPGILFAIVFYFTVTEPQRGRWESQAEANYQPTLKETLKVLSSYRSFLYVAAGGSMAAFVNYGNGNFAPSFLMRSHGYSVSEAGITLALFAGIGGMIGTFIGGFLSDKLARNDKRWYMWLPAIMGLTAVPLTFPYLLIDNTTVVVILMLIINVLNSAYLAPCIAVSHSLVPPAMRALTSAAFFFSINLIGLGLGPVTAGLLSDYLTNIYGTDGLRYAMLIISLVGLVGVAMFVLAAKNLREDLANKPVHG